MQVSRTIPAAGFGRFLVLAALMALLAVGRPGPASGASITVNIVTDTVVAGDGLCSLREALNNFNTTSDTTAGDCTAATGDDLIVLPAGTYTLQGAPAENGNVSGDLDITGMGTLRIEGAGAGSTIIQAGIDTANGVDRVLHVMGSGGTVTLSGVTIRHGRSEGDGGGVFHAAIRTVTIEDSVVRDNEVYGLAEDGGGIAMTLGGTLNIERSTVADNTLSGGGDANGAGIFVFNSVSAAATANVRESIVSGNTGASNGGGLWAGSSPNQVVSVARSVFTNNQAVSFGGGLRLNDSANVANTTIHGNSAGISGGG